jgi:hypothetical protein
LDEPDRERRMTWVFSLFYAASAARIADPGFQRRRHHDSHAKHPDNGF